MKIIKYIEYLIAKQAVVHALKNITIREAN